MSDDQDNYLFSNLRYDEKSTRFDDMLLDGDLVKNWEFVEVEQEANGWWTRLYYKMTWYQGDDFAHMPPSGLVFIVLTIHTEETFPHTGPETYRVGSVVRGNGSFDAIRHTHWGDDGEGYIYYPDFKLIAKIATALDELESSYTRP